MAKLKNPASLSKNSFSASNFFMHILSISVTYFQSVEKIQWKLEEEWISQNMQYYLLGAVIKKKWLS